MSVCSRFSRIKCAFVDCFVVPFTVFPLRNACKLTVFSPVSAPLMTVFPPLNASALAAFPLLDACVFIVFRHLNECAYKSPAYFLGRGGDNQAKLRDTVINDERSFVRNE